MKNVITFIKETDNFFGKIENLILILILFLLVSGSTFQIISRIFFNSGVTWLAPFLRLLVLFTAMIGGAKTVQNNSTIKIDILNNFIADKNKKYSDKIIDLFGMLISIILFIISIKFIIIEKEFAELFLLNIKTWQIELIFPVSFFLMAFHFFSKLFDSRKQT
ncbi:MAG: hypothetical protein ACD_79C01078G0006 [uncultured bacterium]|nr:MAG: hypothetical protein ACD_79C01078G0006 [uncultured bacterium]